MTQERDFESSSNTAKAGQEWLMFCFFLLLWNWFGHCLFIASHAELDSASILIKNVGSGLFLVSYIFYKICFACFLKDLNRNINVNKLKIHHIITNL